MVAFSVNADFLLEKTSSIGGEKFWHWSVINIYHQHLLASIHHGGLLELQFIHNC